MRLLIYGAGVAGGNIAHYLNKRHDKTLLVRETAVDKRSSCNVLVPAFESIAEI